MTGEVGDVEVFHGVCFSLGNRGLLGGMKKKCL
jgi:hypothetical protein